MDPNKDLRMLEAVLCALLAQNGGTARLSVPDIAEVSELFRLQMQTDWQERTITLSLEVVPVPAAVEASPRRVGRPRRLRSRIR